MSQRLADKRSACVAPALLALLAVAIFFPSPIWAQSAVTTGSVEGHVTCDDGNVPGRAAAVSLIPLGELVTHGDDGKAVSAPPGVTADFNGYYIFPSVAPGIYVVDAHKDGYSDGDSMDLGVLRPVLDKFTVDRQRKLLAAFPQVTVAAGTISREDVLIRRAGAISGHVTVDGGGVPGHSTSVIAMMLSSSLLQGLDASANQSLQYSQHVFIDDRGLYRIAGLPAGKYRLSTRITESFFSTVLGKDGSIRLVPARPGIASLIVYAPEALAAEDARVISIGDGDEVSDADLNIPLRLLHSISGIITEGGAPLPGVDIIIRGEHSDASSYDAISMADGSYRFDLLPSGSYTITARVFDTANPPHATMTRKITVQLGENDSTDANVEMLPTQPK